MAPLIAEANKDEGLKKQKKSSSSKSNDSTAAVDMGKEKVKKEKKSKEKSLSKKENNDKSSSSSKESKKRRRESSATVESAAVANATAAEEGCKSLLKSPGEKKIKKSRKLSADEPTDKSIGETGDIADDKEINGTPKELRLSTYRISPTTRKRLEDRGITALFPIQAATFDAIYDGQDVVGRARTGTGKTLSFALPVIERLLLQQQQQQQQRGRQPRVLVMCPTRELAKQVSGEFESVVAGSSFKCLTVYGGTPYWDQERVLRDGCDIVVGTPGRIQDHLDRGNLRLQSIQFIILDE